MFPKGLWTREINAGKSSHGKAKENVSEARKNKIVVFHLALPEYKRVKH
jgi:hypothetical protein